MLCRFVVFDFHFVCCVKCKHITFLVIPSLVLLPWLNSVLIYPVFFASAFYIFPFLVCFPTFWGKYHDQGKNVERYFSSFILFLKE